MAQKTKLKILGPYTPEHEGPFCTEDLRHVEIKIRDGRGVFPVKGYISDETELSEWTDNGVCLGMGKKTDLMNAEEVPHPHEFWINEFRRGDGTIGHSQTHDTPLDAANERSELKGWNWIRTIHVREVLPGEGE